MKLTVLGSSSSGNCYLIHDDKECLVLEAGIPFKEVKKALDFNIQTIVGVLITHEHQDHSKYIDDYIASGIEVYMSKGTAEVLHVSSLAHIIREKESVTCGGFQVSAFGVHHDAEEPIGFYIKHKEIGSLLFATDTYYIDWHFKDLNHILIECNYSQSIMDENCINGFAPKKLRDRTMKSHMELLTCKMFRANNVSSNTKNIILIHLSDRNSDAKAFQEEIYDQTEKQTYIADKDLEVNLNIIPF